MTRIGAWDSQSRVGFTLGPWQAYRNEMSEGFAALDLADDVGWITLWSQALTDADLQAGAELEIGQISASGHLPVFDPPPMPGAEQVITARGRRTIVDHGQHEVALLWSESDGVLGGLVTTGLSIADTVKMAASLSLVDQATWNEFAVHQLPGDGCDTLLC